MDDKNKLMEAALDTLIKKAVREEINGTVKNVRLTRKCAAHLLGVRYITVVSYIKQGYLKEYPWDIDGGTYLLLGEILDYIQNKKYEIATSQ